MKKRFFSIFIMICLCTCLMSTITVSAANPINPYVEMWGENTWSGYGSIIEVKTTATGDLYVPNTVQGLPLTTIERGAFSGCKNITSLQMPNTLTTLEESAFSGCSGLKSITLPAGMVSIPKNAFSGCTSLERIDVAVGGAYYYSHDGALYSKVDNSLILYPQGKKNTEYTIPSGVKTIGNGAFSGNTYVQKVTLADSVTLVDEYAFNNCTGLNEVKLNSNLNEIKRYAFSYSGLTEVTIPENVKTLGQYLFSQTSGIQKIYYNAVNLTSWSEYTLYGINSDYTVEFGDNVEAIPGNMFSAYRLKGITLGKKITEIPEKAFSSCDMKGTLVIPDNIKTIGVKAFSGFRGETIELGSGVETIGQNAFTSSNIKNVIYNGTIEEWNEIAINTTTTSNRYLISAARTYRYANASFNANGGVCDTETARYKTGEVYGSLPVPTKEGYEFLGWYNKDGVKVTEETVVDITGLTTVEEIAASQSLTARWEKEKLYYIGASLNGGSYAEPNFGANPGYKANSEVVIALGEPHRLGHKFLGWSKDENAVTATYQNGDTITIEKSDITLYAVWEKEVYVTVSTMNGVHMVYPTNIPTGSKIMYAAYSGGKLVFFNSCTYNGDSVVPFFATGTYDDLKIMVWDSNMTPIMEVEDVI